RNISVTGAKPLALTDNLNFGNPERPEIMGQLVDCLQGIGDAARALDFPIVSGNVSLYNETQGSGIMPTPAIGGVGVIADVAKAARAGFSRAGETILLIGETRGWLGQSMYQKELCGGVAGAPPPVDLSAERRNGDFVRALIAGSRCEGAHDLSDGGLAVALAEMALHAGVGAVIDALPAGPAHAALFGEDQARYLVVVAESATQAVADAAAKTGVAIVKLGVTGGDALIFPNEAPILLSELRRAHEAPLPAYMDGQDCAFSDRI
ncbi:MAG TPA: AIR synthase-related protein, partial [Methylocystis sp.]|nr:AIR synthase-related protein [Methylocystis sp.]